MSREETLAQASLGDYLGAKVRSKLPTKPEDVATAYFYAAAGCGALAAASEIAANARQFEGRGGQAWKRAGLHLLSTAAIAGAEIFTALFAVKADQITSSDRT